MNRIEIRHIRIQDLDEVAALIAEFSQALVDEALIQITAELDKPTEFGTRFVATTGAEVVGTMGFAGGPIVSPYAAWADWLFVSSKHRRVGIATKLYAAVEASVRAANRAMICLDLGNLEDQTSAYRFHRKNGFRLVGTICDYWGPRDDLHLMQKLLDRA